MIGLSMRQVWRSPALAYQELYDFPSSPTAMQLRSRHLILSQTPTNGQKSHLLDRPLGRPLGRRPTVNTMNPCKISLTWCGLLCG